MHYRLKRICLLLLAIVLCTNLFGCMTIGQSNSLAQSVMGCLKEDQKAKALDAIENAMRETNPAPSQDTLNKLWWDTLLDLHGVPHELLSDDDCKGLSVLAYLLDFTGCFLYSEELSKEMLLTPLEIYYGMDMWLPIYERPRWNTPPFYKAYSPAAGYQGNNCCLSAQEANAFIEQLLGADIPNVEEDGEFRKGSIACKNRIYTIYEGDIIMPDFLVSGYRYLGDALFYVVFDADDYNTPVPNQDHEGIKPESTRLIVRRSSSAWGFTAAAKLSGRSASIFPTDFSSPEGMSYIHNSSLLNRR